jgi:uncharacterized membrane protein
VAAPSASLGAGRKTYLDWLRGVAVIVMVLAHVTDAWTRDADRQRNLYGYTVIVAGLAAPLFLFLAGLTLSMAASARAAAAGHRRAAAYALRRGLQVFALAFLFRLQSQLLGWGPLVNFLKVDILNVMGVAMVVAALLWRLSDNRGARVALFAIATAALAMATPLVRAWEALAILPDSIEAYIRPLAGRTTFALFPWAGFLIAGAIAGELVAAARTESGERRLQYGFLLAGLAGGGLAYALSYGPSIYPNANYWTSSPTYFFVRLGLDAALLPLAWWIVKVHDFRVVNTLGRSSLFVYWIHVEMAYGVISLPLRRALPIELSLLGTVLLCAVLYGLVRVKDRLMAGVTLPGPLRILTPVLR